MSDINDIMLDDEERAEETETVTAADILRKLEEAWLNEKLSVDILEHQADVVDCMLEQIEEMEENLKRLKKGDFRISVHRLEIERIRYILSNYLRIRLAKIEKYCAEILAREKNRSLRNEPSHLSAEEMHFAKSYLAGIEGHLKNVSLKNMPANMQTFDARQSLPKPNLNSYVFLKVNKTEQGVMLSEDDDSRHEVVDLEKDTQHLLPYKSIVHLLKTGAVSLV